MDAKVTAHARFTIADIDKRLYGSFLEHLGRAVYSGIYEPDHPTARRKWHAAGCDRSGSRTRYAGLPLSRRQFRFRLQLGRRDRSEGRSPDAAGPCLAHLRIQQVGIHEFAAWAEAAGTEMMLAVNLGSRGLDAARNFVEYVNHPGGSLLVGAAPQERPERPLGCQVMVPRQRNGRPLADRS